MRFVAIWLIGAVIIMLIAACAPKKSMDWGALLDSIEEQEKSK